MGMKHLAFGGAGILVILILYTITKENEQARTLLMADNIRDVIIKQTKNVVSLTNLNPNKNDKKNTAIHNAIDFVNNRRLEYEQNDLIKRWRMRGVGYLFWYHDMVLMAEMPINPKVGRNVVTIRNVHPAADESYNDCNLWTLYVRVNGPEIFAGSAVAVSSKNDNNNNDDDDTNDNENNGHCYWEFPFDLAKPGSYIVDAKALYYNGTSYMESPCTTYNEEYTNDKNYYHKGFKGFKMYSPPEMCCEICSRISPDCTYWATPPYKLENPGFTNMGCELYFQDNTSEWIPESSFMNETWYEQQQQQQQRKLMRQRQQQRRLGADRTHGPPAEKRPVYYVGCGWSFWMTLDFPCLNGDLDDRIYIDDPNSTFVLEESADEALASSRQLNDDNDALPLCTRGSELPENHKGRWVRKEWPNSTICPNGMEMDKRSDEGFVIAKHDPDHPLCWHRDNLSIIGHDCMEINCRFITKASQWTTSSLRQEKQWYGFYKNYNCQYNHYSDQQLQQCINERKIKTITGSGHSIYRYLNQYLKQRIKNLQFYNSTTGDDDGIEIHLSTLSLLHLKTRETREELLKMPDVDPTKVELYWVNSLYVSSEREHEARGPIQLIKSQIAREILTPKNYNMLNLYDMTAAFTFDTATQRDGMHIIGPPMKMLITKLFHYMCLNISVA